MNNERNFISLNIDIIQMDSKQDTGKHYLKSKTKFIKFEHFPLKAEVIKLLDENNFNQPTLVQAESLPITLQDNLRNLCLIIYAYNGAGKTLTYLIPVFNSLENIPCVGQKFQKVKDHQVGRPQALIIVPTQALLAQVYDYLVAYAEFYEVAYKWTIKIGRIYSTVFQNGHIIVGLARKMQEKLAQKTNFDLAQLKWVVFDECDKVKQDTLPQFSDMLKLLSDPNYNTSTANLLITSATGNKQNFRKFVQENLCSHNIVELDSKDENKGLIGVTHFYAISQSKDQTILNILQKVAKIQIKPQVIIFFNTIPELRQFYHLLKKQKNKFVINNPKASDLGKTNLKVDYIHRDCTNFCRKGAFHEHPEDCSASKTTRITKLKNKQIQVLLGTQTVGRGIDIRTVTLVINYNQPMKNKEDICSTTYIHRVGRTGRYSDEGVALTFVNNTVFIKIAEEEQKIKFQQMKNIDQIINKTVNCSFKNQKIAEIDQHRYHVQ